MRPGVFFGTPAFAACCLSELIAQDKAPQLVVTNPDRPRGRGKHLVASPVAKRAQEHNIPVIQAANITALPCDVGTQLYRAMRNSQCAVVTAYGGLLPKSLLYAPHYGCINVHASLLPRWRGASPIQQALLEGDGYTGVTIMQMNEGLDCGDILLRRQCAIGEDETAGSLHDKLAEIGKIALLDCLRDYQNITPVPQDHTKASYAHKFTKMQARINWHQSALAVSRQIRAYNPAPVAWTCLKKNDTRVRIWEARVHMHALQTVHDVSPGQIVSVNSQGMCVACHESTLMVKVCQFEGGKILDVASLRHSRRDVLKVGEQFI